MGYNDLYLVPKVNLLLPWDTGQVTFLNMRGSKVSVITGDPKPKTPKPLNPEGLYEAFIRKNSV